MSSKAKAVRKRRRAVNPTPEKAEKDLKEAQRVATSRKKNRMLKALASTKGNISAACKRCSITRQTHYEWMNSDPNYALQVDNLEEQLIDNLESLFLKLTNQKEDLKALQWLLERKGRKRGYGKVEHHEISGPEGEPIRTEGTLAIESMRDQLPDDALAAALGDLVKRNPELVNGGGRN